MEQLGISQDRTHFHIDDFPDAVKVIGIDGPLASRLSDLSLHKNDLEFAENCLLGMNLVPEEPIVLREALWRSAILHFFKCFGDSGARFQLSPEKILKGEPPEAMLAFNYFKDLRNRHFVHDENSYSQSNPGAILNRGDKEYKIEKIVCLTTRAVTADQGNFNNLILLIRKAKAMVISDFDNLCTKITAEMESQPYEILLSKPDLSYRAPVVEEIGKNRKAP